jgi:hypothetical protein
VGDTLKVSFQAGECVAAPPLPLVEDTEGDAISPKLPLGDKLGVEVAVIRVVADPVLLLEDKSEADAIGQGVEVVDGVIGEEGEEEALAVRASLLTALSVGPTPLKVPPIEGVAVLEGEEE